MDIIDNFFFIERDGNNFLFFKKLVKTKPYIYFGKKSLIGLAIFLVLHFWLEKTSFTMERPWNENLLILVGYSIVTFLWIKDFIDYRKI